MTLYRSKPTEVEAAHWNGRNLTDELIDLAGDKARVTGHGLELLAGKDGAQEWVPVPDGHWIVRQPGDSSDIWPVDPDYFAAKYERAEPFYCDAETCEANEGFGCTGHNEITDGEDD